MWIEEDTAVGDNVYGAKKILERRPLEHVASRAGGEQLPDVSSFS